MRGKNSFCLLNGKSMLLTLSLLVCLPLHGQSGWQNPSDRYSNAYKDYLNTELSVRDDGISHFVYFARDREAVRNHPFLTIPQFEGAQIMYSWKDLEPEKDRYDFSAILEDYQYLQARGKKLFVQLQDATFMPGEWLPWEDSGYLRSVYQYGQEIGVGLGAPDLMVERRAQLNHALAMMHEGEYTVPLGIAVQDGNYIGRTGTDLVFRDRKTIVPLLHAFAKDFLGVSYMFWSYQEPYFREDVIPYFTK